MLIHLPEDYYRLARFNWTGKIIDVLYKGICISEKGDFMTSKINLWGWEKAISPELFIQIRLHSGVTSSWKRENRIFES